MHARTLPALLAFVLALGSVAFAGDTFNGLPLHVEHLTDNAIRLWVGDYISTTAVSALNTDKGIVVIDATELPDLDKKFRKVIAREFGRKDFVYLINTHEHADHTTGNGVYRDCEIVAHERCAEGMQSRRGDGQRVIEWFETNIPELEKELARMEKGTEAYDKTGEDLILKKLKLKTWKSGVPLTFPTRTFSDSLTLDMGNMTVELYYAGGTHTASDIFVFVPEEGLLFTGDMMADEWFTDTPGCLQAFSMRQGIERDLPLMLANWKSLIARKDEIEQYVPGHWNGGLTYKGFADRYEYVATLYEGIGKAAEERKELNTLLTEFDMANRFPHLEGTPGFTERFVHYGTLLALWSDLTGTESASAALEAGIEEKDLQTAVAEIEAERAKDSGKYYFLEAEFNALGYRFIQHGDHETAIAVFKLNAQLYPDSWNVYDSLAEAYMRDGQNDLAIRHYNRSVELNPDNENGKQMLEQIRTGVAGG